MTVILNQWTKTQMKDYKPNWVALFVCKYFKIWFQFIDEFCVCTVISLCFVNVLMFIFVDFDQLDLEMMQFYDSYNGLKYHQNHQKVNFCRVDLHGVVDWKSMLCN